jgi:hypothetical protein
MDESTDIRDTAYLLVFIWMVFEDFSIKEGLLGMITLKVRTTRQEIKGVNHGGNGLLNELRVARFSTTTLPFTTTENADVR